MSLYFLLIDCVTFGERGIGVGGGRGGGGVVRLKLDVQGGQSG